jgi:hypothetical protein
VSDKEIDDNMTDKKNEPKKDPTDYGGMLDQFKENITISKDKDGILVKFKKLAPSMSLETLKSMMENMMGAGGKDLMKQFSSIMGKDEDDDGDEVEAEDDDEGSDEEDEGPGFKVEILEDGTGLKLVPDDPAQIDEFMESIKAIFDPAMFKNMMQAVSQLFGIQSPGMQGTGTGMDPEDKEKRKAGTDTNMSRDYFYT